MNFITRSSLSFLLICLSINHAYADQTKKNLDIQDVFQPVTSIESNGAVYTFSGTTADNINYIRFCKATDDTCSSCSTPYWTYFANNGIGIPYTTGGTSYTLLPSTIQNYLTKNGLGDGTYYIGLYVQSTDLICNSSGSNSYQSYCSTNKDDNNHVLCVQAVSSGGTSTLARVEHDDGIAVLSSNTTPYLYVNNGPGVTPPGNYNTISVCPLSTMDTTNHTFTCSTANNTMTQAVSTPKGIALDPIFANAYIMSNSSSSTNSVGCTTSSTNGSLTCTSLTNSGTTAFGGSNGIAIDPPGTNAYIINGGNTLLACPITLGSPGSLACASRTLGGITLSAATGVTIDRTNSYMYIANTNSNNLVACTLDGSTCGTLGDTSSNKPSYPAINNANNYIYIPNGGGSSVNVCSVTGTTIGTCTNAGASGVNRGQGIVLNPAGTLAFIANSNGFGHNNITVCSINTGSTPPTFVSGSCNVYTDIGGTSGASTFSTNIQGLAWANVVGP